MNFLTNYDSDNDEEKSGPTLTSNYVPVFSNSLIIAPIAIAKQNTVVIHTGDNLSINNLPGELSGPTNPFKQKFGVKLSITEESLMDDYAFNQQYDNYQRAGYALDTNTNEILGDHNAYYHDLTKKSNKRIKLTEKKRDLSELEEDGPWTVMDKQDIIEYIPPTVDIPESYKQKSDKTKDINKKLLKNKEIEIEETKIEDKTMYIIEPDEEAEKWERYNEKKLGSTVPSRPARGSTTKEATSTFHGSNEVDYQGNSWNSVPKGIHVSATMDDQHDCYIPKKCIKKYIGHNKGVQSIEFIPNTGHLLLSGSMDGKCKIWDVLSDKNVKRTYIGHSEAVK